MSTVTDATTRTAQCGCGALSFNVSGEPKHVYTCSCTNCQRESGSAFTYCAIYSDSAVNTLGDPKLWRRSTTESGRWIESGFCPSCGVTVFFRMEAWPNVVGVSVGCFADPGFAQPSQHYWASRKHAWLSVPDGTEVLSSQD
ncbi:MAG: GFA family protein [Pseudomonadota bacterium]